MPFPSAIDSVFAYWLAHAQPDATHRSWLERHARLLPDLCRRQPVPLSRTGTEFVDVVIHGLLARVVHYPDGKRRITRLVQPGEAVGTAVNLYTHKRYEGELIALRPTRVLRLPAAELKAFKEADRAADDLVDAWREREKKRIAAHESVLLIPDDRQRCAEFRRLNEELCKLLTHQVIADHLNVSRDTVKRAFNPKKGGW